MTRYAVRHTTRVQEDLRVMDRYMPSNYAVRAVTTPHGDAVLVFGEDVAGWTLDSYVQPRLASGLLFAREITAVEAGTYLPLKPAS